MPPSNIASSKLRDLSRVAPASRVPTPAEPRRARPRRRLSRQHLRQAVELWNWFAGSTTTVGTSTIARSATAPPSSERSSRPRIWFETDRTRPVSFEIWEDTELRSNGVSFITESGVLFRLLPALDLAILPTASYTRGEPRFASSELRRASTSSAGCSPPAWEHLARDVHLHPATHAANVRAALVGIRPLQRFFFDTHRHRRAATGRPSRRADTVCAALPKIPTSSTASSI